MGKRNGDCTAAVAQTKAVKALCDDWANMHTIVHYADADEPPDAVEVMDRMTIEDNVIDVSTEYLESEVEEAKPVVKKFAYERRKWFASEPSIESPSEAKRYARSGAPALHGGILSVILRHSVKFA